MLSGGTVDESLRVPSGGAEAEGVAGVTGARVTQVYSGIADGLGRGSGPRCTSESPSEHELSLNVHIPCSPKLKNQHAI